MGLFGDKEGWSNASLQTRGYYKSVFAPHLYGKKHGDVDSLGKRVALGSALVLGNIATLGLVNLGILVRLRFGGGGQLRGKHKVKNEQRVKQRAREIIGLAIKKTPSGAPTAPSEHDAYSVLLATLGVGNIDIEQIVSDQAFQQWWEYFMDRNNMPTVWVLLDKLIKEEKLQQMI